MDLIVYTGTFAVVNIMVGKAVLEYSDYSWPAEETAANPGLETIPKYSAIEVATALAFLIGLIQVSDFLFNHFT